MRIFVDLLLIAICGGLFVVPLYAIIQSRSDEAARARTIAAMNIMNALFMTAAAAVTALLLSSGLGTSDLWLILAILNAGVALWICRLLPQDTLRLLARIVLRLAYRVELRGAEHLAAAGERVVIVPNHVSHLDGPADRRLSAGLSDVFAIDTAQAQKRWARPLLAGRTSTDGPGAADGDEVADPGAARGPAMRDLPRGKAQRDRRRADEDL